ncbi:hypothetical protein V6N11_071317 [Hibiscus sabdariffa]|uniref:DUF4283 domain-containing protein n=1 Tax=Hibiscus sabdariffa TaxID=183260 RepID=A0ABR2U0F9_9ROSI
MRAAMINEAHMMRIIGNMVLVIFDSTEAHECILAYEMLDTWFERVENRKALCGMEHHRVWLSIYSVPIHSCTKETFERVASIWGSVIFVEEETLEPASFKLQEDQCDGSSSEQGGSLVNLEASDVGNSPELVEIPLKAVQESFETSELPVLDGSSCDVDLGTVGPVMPPKGSSTEAVKIMLRKNEVHMVFIMETKLTTVNDRLVKQVWRSDSYVFEFIPSVGLSDGILDIGVGSVGVYDGCSVCTVYALGALRSLAEGRFFTWYGSGSKGSQVDQFLVFAEWLDHFDGLEQRNLPHSVSDHDPVRLSYGEVNWGSRPFCFLNVWLEHKGMLGYGSRVASDYGCAENLDGGG